MSATPHRLTSTTGFFVMGIQKVGTKAPINQRNGLVSKGCENLYGDVER